FKPLSLFMILPPPRSTLFPYTTLFRSIDMPLAKESRGGPVGLSGVMPIPNSEAVGSLRAGTACVWLSRCAVKRRSLMKLGEKTDVYARLAKERLEVVVVGKPGTLATAKGTSV